MTMSGKELVILLKKNGWTEIRIQGSHHIMEKNGNVETVPVHGNKDLPKGLLTSILKRTGLF